MFDVCNLPPGVRAWWVFWVWKTGCSRCLLGMPSVLQAASVNAAARTMPQSPTAAGEPQAAKRHSGRGPMAGDAVSNARIAGWHAAARQIMPVEGFFVHDTGLSRGGRRGREVRVHLAFLFGVR